MPESRKNRNNPSYKITNPQQRTKKIARRVYLLFFVIGLLFLVLIGKLYNMQIQNKAFYDKKLAVSATGGNLTITQGAPRGQIFDANGTPLATTTGEEAVQFTRSQASTAQQMRNTALKLASLLDDNLEMSNLTDRDKKDFFLADPSNLAKIAARLPKSEKFDKSGNALSNADLYANEVKAVTADDINFDANTTQAAQLFKAMNSTITYSTTIIASGNVTAEQQAYIGAHASDLPGISMGNSWNRDYAQNDLTSLLGTVTSQKTGLPSNLATQYLKEGYQPNDRVGTAYLEQGYEKYLQGTHQISKVEINKSGEVTGTKTIQEGQKGDNLKLTIDLNFQNGVDQIVQNQMADMINQGFGAYASGAYAVVMNTQTGGILAMSGFDRDATTGTITKDTNATFQDAFPPGSVVKPATLTAGWANNVISGNQILDDQPITFQGGGNTIESWFTNGVLPITAVQALEYSSNTYMVQVALKLLGQPYSPGMTLSDQNRAKAFDELRKAYASYGLGTNTGFDVPGESTGLIYPTSDAKQTTVANALFEAFGQYDTYTPLQLATYAATLANNGKRITPHIVQGIYQDKTNSGGLGTLIKTIEPKTEDNVDITPDNMDVLHEGMYQVVNGNDMVDGQLGATGYWMRQSEGAKVSISAKTGTSQTNVVAPDGSIQAVTVNNVVAFAPTDNPQIAIAVMVPNTTVKTGGVTSEISQYITRDITNLYFSQHPAN